MRSVVLAVGRMVESGEVVVVVISWWFGVVRMYCAFFEVGSLVRIALWTSARGVEAGMVRFSVRGSERPLNVDIRMLIMRLSVDDMVCFC